MAKRGRGRRNNRRDMRVVYESRMKKTREERVEENRKQMEKNKYEAKRFRKEKESAMKEKLFDRYDIELLNNGESMKISLAAKCCPSVDSSYDKALLICESIARILYPWDSDNNERFRSYLEKVKLGDAKISAGALLPHEIISSLQSGSGGGMVAELQWKRMVNDLLKGGKLTNCIAVCDVSGSMSGTPMDVCVALGLLVSELSEERSHGKRVFETMLEVAVRYKLSEDDMVKRVFVFSDMEFDQASSSPWETDYEAIQRKFKSHGYVNVPEIVFWNLRDSRATPVTANQKGVALLSGFSKNLLTLFLEGGGVINPEDVPKRSVPALGECNSCCGTRPPPVEGRKLSCESIYRFV
ncbi:hypothetical protein CTI12_AA493010 [Artemisia annua]|uniref:von Willebrand factor, type A n=1 Tax=Artemisia annua TaxID=35608 RepID=A0A2U1KTD6_ARTAN|nr:hypothetical protein CTI12_AA493010 [Artemisia annua]